MGTGPDIRHEVSRGSTTGPADPLPGPRPRTGPPGAPWNSEAPSVLLIEDDDGDALLVEELVLDSGVPLKLRRATSLAETVRELSIHVPQCVLLDLHLPDAQGLEALRTVLDRTPESAVVVLTGLAEEQAGLAAVAAGAQDYLIKGRLEADLFVRAIRYAVQRKQTELAAAALQAGRLRAQENARLERGLLPTPLLVDDSVAICARYQPGRAQTLLGGDFYDIVQTPDGTTHAVVGDVSGHGPDEAALGVCLRVAWRSFVLAGARGQRLLGLLERILLAERSGPEIFATLTTLSRTAGDPHMDVQRAGHLGLLLRSPDTGVRLEEVPGGPALGLLPDHPAHWPVTRVAVPENGAVMLFTDGLVEGRTGVGTERLGEEGLLALARLHADLPAHAFVDTLIHSAQELAAADGGLADDVAVLHLEWKRPT
ncbi:SpoIIE family protein phosphatase [Streptomyces sp. SID4919]|uniref:PP2C family protein-serine/threonine phosphatase n=1 Tax=unclassified Streptomyces TaxID=2593676 RepID=UPI000823E147|nr:MULTISPECIES: SpoIIE family protein phosphatase [unclassified Streptomyces]MYY08639.1 SpoIIE family protein phosphatase [Streptomyces sp. SID4919]SCK55604.1 Serine phosphatase RsbU, regulator of sigma subunit [Streptomyces sp. AmelKG-E11A]